VAETYMVQLTVEDDEVDWELFAIDKRGIWESVDRGCAAVYSDALLEASMTLKPFMPEWLQ
jgi:hypothetical protein